MAEAARSSKQRRRLPAARRGSGGGMRGQLGVEPATQPVPCDGQRDLVRTMTGLPPVAIAAAAAPLLRRPLSRWRSTRRAHGRWWGKAGGHCAGTAAVQHISVAVTNNPHGSKMEQKNGTVASSKRTLSQ